MKITTIKTPTCPLSNLLTNILAESSSAIPSMSLSCLLKASQGFLSLHWDQISTLYLSLESTPEQAPTLSAPPCVSAAFTQTKRMSPPQRVHSGLNQSPSQHSHLVIICSISWQHFSNIFLFIYLILAWVLNLCVLEPFLLLISPPPPPAPPDPSLKCKLYRKDGVLSVLFTAVSSAHRYSQNTKKELNKWMTPSSDSIDDCGLVE